MKWCLGVVVSPALVALVVSDALVAEMLTLDFKTEL